MEPEKYHIMMFPWLAFGHMIPFLELSKNLASKGMSISYVSTPKNLQRLLSQIPSKFSQKITFLEIPIPRVEGLPENCEATIDLQPEEIQYLKKAYDELAEPFQKLLEEVRPDLILVDFAPYWVPEIAAKFGIQTGFFSVYTAATLAYMGPPDELSNGKKRSRCEHYSKPPEWVPFHSLVAYEPYYAQRIMFMRVPDASGVSTSQRVAKILENCSFVLVKTSEEFEGEYISLVRELYKKPVIPIGLLSPLLEEKNRNIAMNSTTTFLWLDSQKPKSVVFVGFGSEYKMPVDEIHELAFALELSKLPFLWILRKPQKLDNSSGLLLPPGFTERTLGRGRVVLEWAPQVEILSHVAIGACLFHSGWSTIVESLCFGHPLILLPMVADQGLNAKLLVEKEVGYEVPRNRDGSFSREVVAESIRRVVVGPEGEKLRSRAAEMRSVFDNRESQSNYIDKFIEHLEKYNDITGKKKV